MATLPSDELWVVTCYFNPAHYQTRLVNYRAFRRWLGAPLLTVEWSAEGGFELGGADADRLIQLSGGDVMWQKERLLNVGIASLPPACRKVAWVDCDAVFDRADWAEATAAALDQHAMVQLFSERYNLSRGEGADTPAAVRRNPAPAESLVQRWRTGRATQADFCDPDAPCVHGSTAGLAWAARREVLEPHGLYDACVMGSGDRAILCAALGRPDWAAGALNMSPGWERHYRRWAQAFHGDVAGRVGCVEGGAAHLWHGHLEDRRYGARKRLLHQVGFSPDDDLALTDRGCWRWASDKPRMHDAVCDYFRQRCEDGRPVLA